ncbi:sce7726 family protein [Shewanella sp. C32]|uniref:Sce7726 family protein n=1 Tax=Shewanella electrica TaxID=515560 RepID=A0ABT2FJC3_9GAMM|nr:sce7726 family protein [Shewanella electrica]MCH1924529.1 sce7726 family protein [Shewanella electrica]MCS4556430.1 sce7726 family protein [Shewanella electrica]
MLEIEVKASFINYLRKRNNRFSDGVIVNEFVYDNFNRRADLLYIKGNRLFAYEIKSEADSLSRLPGQIDNYLGHFDKVIMVVATKHVGAVLDMTPSVVEVIEIKPEGNFKIIRRGKISKNIESRKLLNLLKVKEIRQVAKKIGVSTHQNTKKTLIDELSCFKSNKLKGYIIQSISQRFTYSSSAFNLICGGRDVVKDDLNILSNNKKENKVDNIFLDKKNNCEDKKMLEMQRYSKHPIFGKVPSIVLDILKERDDQ